MRGKKQTQLPRKTRKRRVVGQPPLLKVILKIENLPNRKALLKASGQNLVESATVAARNVLSGHIPIKNKALRKTIFYTRRQEFEKLASSNTPRSQKIALLSQGGQKGGFFGALMRLSNMVNYGVPSVSHLL